jgi:hypothetical protein
MAYFFDLEDFETTCRSFGDAILKSINESFLANQATYYQMYGTLDGFTPSQDALVLNNDGSISTFVYISNGLEPIEVGGYCCTTKVPYIIQTANNRLGVLGGVDTTTIYWDADKQQCRWKQEPEYCALDSFKVILNAVGDDGAMFNIDNDDKQCSLNIEFDYLFKMDCQDLANILNPSINTNQVLLSQINILQNSIEKLKVSCSQTTYEIENTSRDFVNSSYSIVSCPNFVPFAYGIRTANTYKKVLNIIYCINEENDGLTQWQNILGPSRYKRFLDGDVNSYTCSDVTSLIEINNQLLRTNSPTIIEECTTPFGYKSNLKKQIDELILTQKTCQEEINTLETELNGLLAQSDIPSTCTTPIEVLETLDVSMTLEVVESDGSLTNVFESELFPAIGTGNLYEYLQIHPYDSGFYICGVGTGDESFLSGCTVLKYNDELTGPTAPFTFNCGDVNLPADFHCNVESCRIVKDSFLRGLYEQSGLSNSTDDRNTFKASLSKEIFASKWLNFSTIIDDATIIELIKNKKVKLSLKINNTCSNVCVYIDNIKLIRDCVDGNGKTVLISESPGFQLDRIIDNKKSWIKNSIPVNRTFDIANNQGGNVIRRTDYDVNDERLVINTKEIDLDINIASAIENDVQCYINDNLNLLDSVPSNDCGCSESLPCYEDVFKIISYSDAVDSGIIPAPIDPEDLMVTTRAIRDAWLKAWNELMLATPPYLDIKNGIYHPNPSEDVMTTYRATRDAWRKALHQFNLASGGGFIEGLTIDKEMDVFEGRDYTYNTFTINEKLAPQMFNTKCGKIFKFYAEGGYMYFVSSPSKELKVYWANTDFAPRNTTWIDITSVVQEDYASNWNYSTPPTTPEKASYFCKYLGGVNYNAWVQMMSFQYQTDGNTSHNEWVNPVEDTFFVEWDSKKGKCMTNMFKEVVPEQFSMHYPITSLNFWTNYSDSTVTGDPQCDLDVYLRNSGSTACSGVDFSWPNVAADIDTLSRVYRDANFKRVNETKLTERTPLYYLYLIDPNTNLVPDETSGYIPIKVTTTIRKDSHDGDIVFKEEYVLNDSTSTCDYREPSSDGLALVRVYIGITDPNSAYWDVNAYNWDFINVCTGSTEAGTYISGSTSTLPLAGASDNGVDRNWSFNENYYVHFDVVNNNTNQVYHVTNNDFNLKDKTLPIVCPTSASTQTFDINSALNSINTHKTKMLSNIQEDLDFALNACTDC